MPWGTVEATTEVATWYASLDRDPDAKARVTHDFAMLAELGPNLGEPHSRQLRGKLRELRSRRDRITYYLASGQRAILLTRFTKGQRRETAEVERAERALKAHMETDR